MQRIKSLWTGIESGQVETILWTIDWYFDWKYEIIWRSYQFHQGHNPNQRQNSVYPTVWTDTDEQETRINPGTDQKHGQIAIHCQYPETTSQRGSS